MQKTNIVKCTCGLVATGVVFDLYSYRVRELLVSLALFTVAYLILALIVLAAVLLWWVSEQLTNRAGPASRRVLAFSRHLIAAYAKP